MTTKTRMNISLKSINASLYEGAACIMTILFVYTAVSKVNDWSNTRNALYNQGLPTWLTELLLYGLPLVEVLIAVVLLIPTIRRIGFILGTGLMLVFTGYVAWIWLGFTAHVPCSCGGVLSGLGWGEHLVFNLLFLGIAGYGWWAGK